jgi:hypothetical protein
LLYLFSVEDLSNAAGDEDDTSEEECVSVEPERRLDLNPLSDGVEVLTTIGSRLELPPHQPGSPQGHPLSADHLRIVLCSLTC